MSIEKLTEQVSAGMARTREAFLRAKQRLSGLPDWQFIRDYAVEASTVEAKADRHGILIFEQQLRLVLRHGS